VAFVGDHAPPDVVGETPLEAAHASLLVFPAAILLS
jgi:hypothetical protein